MNANENEVWPRGRARRFWIEVALIPLLVLAMRPTVLTGQESRTPSARPTYLTAGLGVGTKDLAGHLGLTVHFPVGEFTLRVAGVTDFNLLGPNAGANDVALLYGIRHVEGTSWYSLTAGPAAAWASREACVESARSTSWFGCSRYEVVERQWRPGVGFQGTVGWRHVSLSFLGDLNGASDFAAATFNVHLGTVR